MNSEIWTLIESEKHIVVNLSIVELSKKLCIIDLKEHVVSFDFLYGHITKILDELWNLNINQKWEIVCSKFQYCWVA